MKNKPFFKILIVEDEIILAHTMKEMLFELGYSNITASYNFNHANSILNEANLDLAILDINLGKGEEGIELAKICKQKSIPFFYVTSYTDKVTLDKALETTPGAYLVKPYLQSNLYTALQITLNSNNKVQTISVKEGTEILKIDIKEIVYFYSENIYIKIVTAKKKHLIRSSLQAILNQLPKDVFYQTHRAYAVNINFVTKQTFDFIELGEYQVPLSRSFKSEFKKIFTPI